MCLCVFLVHCDLMKSITFMFSEHGKFQLSFVMLSWQVLQILLFYICNGNPIFVDRANITTHPWQILHFSLPWQHIVFTCHGQFRTYIAMSNLLVKFWKILKHGKLLQTPREKGAAAARSWRHRCKGIRGDSHVADGRAGDGVSVVGVGRRVEVTPSISGLALYGSAGRSQMRRVLMGPAMGAQVSAASFLRRAPPLHVWASTYSMFAVCPMAFLVCLYHFCHLNF